MIEKNDMFIDDSSSNDEKISVGATLRKQRISMNLSVERISKDLRISKTYIEAIESDKFDAIPATAYVRVYVKTIAEYLSLDSVKLLKQLSEENAKISRLYTTEISIIEDTPSDLSIAERKKNKKIILTAILVAMLIVLGYFAVVNNNNYNRLEAEQQDEETQTLGIIEEVVDTTDNYDEIMPDSLIRGDTIILDSAATANDSSATRDTTSANTQDTTAKKVEVTIRTLNDTATVMVVTDGIITHNRPISSQSKEITVSAIDSINIYSYNGSRAIDIFFKGKRVSKIGSRGIWTITPNGARNLSASDWQKVKRVEE